MVGSQKLRGLVMPLWVLGGSLPVYQGFSASLVWVKICLTDGFPRAGQSAAWLQEPHHSQPNDTLSSPISNSKAGLLQGCRGGLLQFQAFL